MKALARNKQTFYYALPTGSLTNVYDTDGFYTGEQEPGFNNPVQAEMNISPATGRTVLEWFGVNEAYDKVIVTDDVNCPITETSRLWIDTMPVIAGEPQKQTDPPAGSTSTPHDYIVSRIARSLNSTLIGVRKVSVT